MLRRSSGACSRGREARAEGGRARTHEPAGADHGAARAARSAGLHAAAVRQHRRRADGSRHLQVLHGAWACRCCSSTARPSSVGIYCIQRRGEVDFDTVGRGFNDDYEIRIDKPDAQGVGEIVSQHPTCSRATTRTRTATRADLREGWMHTGRRRLLQAVGPARRHRPHARPRHHVVRRALLAAIHREQAQVLALRQPRRWCSATSAPTSRRSCASASRSSPSGPSRTACRSRPIPTSRAARGLPPDRGRDRAHERIAAAGAAGRQVRAALQGARCRRRRAHPHAQGAPRRGLRRNTSTSSRRSMPASPRSRSTPRSPSRTAPASASARPCRSPRSRRLSRCKERLSAEPA